MQGTVIEPLRGMFITCLLVHYRVTNAILCWVFFYSVPDDLFQNISYWPYFRKLFVYFTLPSTYQPSSICNAIRNFVYDYKCLVVSVQDTL